MLLTHLGLEDIDHKHDFVVFIGDFIELDDNHFVIAVAGSGEVIAHVLHGIGAVTQVAEIDHIFAGRQSAVLKQNGRSVAVYRYGVQKTEAF